MGLRDDVGGTSRKFRTVYESFFRLYLVDD